MSNPWNEWQKLAKSPGMISGMNQSDKRNLYSAAKANLLKTDLPMTGETIFESALELRDTGLVTKSPQPVIYKSPFAAAARELSSRTTPGSNRSMDLQGLPIAPATNWSGYSDEETGDAASRFAEELEFQSTPMLPERVSYESAIEPFARASMDDEERKQALQSILGNYADRESLVDDIGLPLGKEQLLTLAKLTPIWGALSSQQKHMFLSENGTFASWRKYVATAKVASKAPIRKTIIQASSGKVLML
jgi:hypothetical protein